MMYLITYDLHQGIFHNYQPFLREIEQIGSWWRYMDRTWIVATDLPLKEVADRLTKHLGQPDRLLIIPLKQPYTGWLPNEAWEWIDEMYRQFG